jgi:hypothetical protein
MEAIGIEQTGSIGVMRRGEVVFAVVRGLYRLDDHRRVRAKVISALERKPARAVVFDLRRAVSTLGDRCRETIVLESLEPPGNIMVPVGMVVTPPMLNASVKQCSFAWSHGRMWVSFLDLDDALDWAAGQRARRALAA